MKNDTQINSITGKIKILLPQKSLVIVSIDGRGASGKSSLSRTIKSTIEETQLVEYDDFYYPLAQRNKETENEDFNFDYTRLINQVLTPLRELKNVNYQRYNWTQDEHDGLVEGYNLTPHGLIIIEGCYSMRPELLPYFDLHVWVECNKNICRERGIKRSVELKHHYWNNMEALNNRWNELQRLEDLYIDKFNPKTKADFIYQTD